MAEQVRTGTITASGWSLPWALTDPAAQEAMFRHARRVAKQRGEILLDRSPLESDGLLIFGTWALPDGPVGWTEGPGGWWERYTTFHRGEALVSRVDFVSPSGTYYKCAFESEES